MPDDQRLKENTLLKLKKRFAIRKKIVTLVVIAGLVIGRRALRSYGNDSFFGIF